MGLFIVREGDGEADALPSLVIGIRTRLGLNLPFVPRNGCWKRPLVHEGHVRETCELARRQPGCDALLLTRDADQDQLAHADCPKYTAPEMAHWIRARGLPFPVAVVLFYKEYETLFLAGADSLAGRAVVDQRGEVVDDIPEALTAHPDPEHPRDAKGWTRQRILAGYKPTLHQYPLTRLLDLDVLSASGLSSYHRLESALAFLAKNLGVAGAVYPPAAGGRP